jgi:S-adenosylmethionine synthetase
VVRAKLVEIGYTSSEIGLDGNSCGVLVSIGQQSQEISASVSKSQELRAGSNDALDSLGAGDQGMMYGFACNENEAYMPTPIHLAHRLAEGLARLRRELANHQLRPDGKTQVTIQYDGLRPVGISDIIVSAQHSPLVTQPELHALLTERLVQPVAAASGLDISQLRVLINPSGSFAVGGPQGDAGLTGRKIIVDTYGGMARHGGGAFSGKDPSKVDRSAAYAMRWVAKNIVAAGLADRAETRVSYAIGKAHPVAFDIETFGTEQVDAYRIRDAVLEVFDLRPAAIVNELQLRRPIYSQTSTYGHFGRAGDGFTWESTAKAKQLLDAIG